jgi:hypothetical protein
MNIKLEQEGRDLSFIKYFGEILDVEEFVMYASFLYEISFGIQNKVIHARG